MVAETPPIEAITNPHVLFALSKNNVIKHSLWFISTGKSPRNTLAPSELDVILELLNSVFL
jgi:hypothetical protein